MPTRLKAFATALLFLLTAAVSTDPIPVDWPMVAKIREEGLQHSKVMDYEELHDRRAGSAPHPLPGHEARRRPGCRAN